MALVTVIRGPQEGLRLTDLAVATLEEKRRKEPLSEDDWIRVSSMGGLCPREEVLCVRHNVLREESIDGYAGVNFQNGNGVHWMMQNKVLAPTGQLIGSWRCTYCGEVYGSRRTEMVPRPARCVRCGAVAGEVPRPNNRPVDDVLGDAFLYVEEWIGNEEYKIGGSPDGQMVFCDPRNFTLEDVVLLEFKSVNDRNFYKFKAVPDLGHVIQVQCYLWLTGFRRAKIVYFNKNFSPADKTPFHEHDMDYDPEVVERVQDAIKKIREGANGGEIPPRTLCARRDCYRAMGCKVANQCFA